MFALSQCEASQAFTSIKKTGRSSRHRREDGMQIIWFALLGRVLAVGAVPFRL